MSVKSQEASEVERQIEVLIRPSGDPQYRRMREDALAYLLEHADRAHPKLLELATGDFPPVWAILALPQFGRADSVPVLEKLLREASDPATVTAAEALARHPRPESRGALERGLTSSREQVVMSAAEGLALRGDRAACPALAQARTHASSEVRERIAGVEERLGCRAFHEPSR